MRNRQFAEMTHQYLQALKFKRSMLTTSLFILLFKEMMKSHQDNTNKKLEELKGINSFYDFIFIIWVDPWSGLAPCPWSLFITWILNGGPCTGSMKWSIDWIHGDGLLSRPNWSGSYWWSLDWMNKMIQYGLRRFILMVPGLHL